MASEDAKKDSNSSYSLLGVTASGETRNIRVNDAGEVIMSDSTSGSDDSVYRHIDVDETKREVAAVDVRLKGYIVTNRATSERTIKFYAGPASGVTVGTTTPVISFTLGGGQSANIRGLNLKFVGGLTLAATTGVADNDTGAPATNDVQANIFYRAA